MSQKIVQLSGNLALTESGDLWGLKFARDNREPFWELLPRPPDRWEGRSVEKPNPYAGTFLYKNGEAVLQALVSIDLHLLGCGLAKVSQ